MKTPLFFFLLIAISFSCYSQSKFTNDTIYLETGYKIYKGIELNIGVGATPDGDFKFIRRNSTGFGTLMEVTNNNSYNKSQLSLPRTFAGHKASVIKIVERGTKKMGFTYEPLVSFGSGRYEIDIDNAIATGELKVPDEFKVKTVKETIVIQQPTSVADELTKLKKLFDDGVLSKEEYDAQKTKVLSHN